MAQIYKIFINESPLIIAHPELQVANHDECVEVPEDASLIKLVSALEHREAVGFILRTHEVDKIVDSLFKHFIVIHAAGGIVFNDFGEILLIKRLGKWDLPKGKVDQGESIEQAAIREVEEEAGVEGLILGEHIVNSYHTYKHQGHRFLKATHWYRMNTDYEGPLKPQTEEKITEAIWTSPEKLDVMNLDSYRSIIDVLIETLASSN